ncbi:MAG: restriction endonuclease [Myxococcales bacterium]|nr:restriction endonuclease [Myxococcales bacterium]
MPAHPLDPLLDLLYLPRAAWAEQAHEKLQTALANRYQRVGDLKDRAGDKRIAGRFNVKDDEGNIPYVGLIAPGQERMGPYGGMSFVLFPADAPHQRPALVTMVVGTQGLAPDEGLLGRPGHARACRGIAEWYRRQLGPRSAWAKVDPVRIDLDVPAAVKHDLAAWKAALDKYGTVLYATFVLPGTTVASEPQRPIVLRLLAALLDLTLGERGFDVKKDHEAEKAELQQAWLEPLLPATDAEALAALLGRRRFVVLEGPPGTGKTRLALELLQRHPNRGRVVQFHPGTTYESFVGGLAPVARNAELGLAFEAAPGHLMQAAIAARRCAPEPYLLVIDEINRADLAKVLGEAIFLFEPGEPDRVVHLAHDFPDFGRTLSLPSNLHVLGTMNSADRSIAILDLAIRRRFAFVRLWPQPSVLEAQHPELQQAFRELLTLFVEHAPDDVLALLPGHAYFLGLDEAHARTRLRTELRPLLEEYLAQGYVAPIADHVRAWLDRLAV